MWVSVWTLGFFELERKKLEVRESLRMQNMRQLSLGRLIDLAGQSFEVIFALKYIRKCGVSIIYRNDDRQKQFFRICRFIVVRADDFPFRPIKRCYSRSQKNNRLLMCPTHFRKINSSSARPFQ